MSDEFLLKKDVQNIPLPLLIVCEGYSDARFIHRLLEQDAIANCVIGWPSKEGLGKGNGFEAIPKYLEAVRGITKGKDAFKGLLVVADADSVPDDRFTSLTKALSDAEFSPPEQPYSLEGKEFRVAVFLIPEKGKTGTLDNLLLEAALKNNPVMQQCLDSFCECANHTQKWKANQQAKMRLSVLVAASCENNPWASLAIMWSEKGNPVPVDSDSFGHIRAFLKSFADLQ